MNAQSASRAQQEMPRFSDALPGDELFIKAFKAHIEFVHSLRNAKIAALTCGIFLLQAQRQCALGDWQLRLSVIIPELPDRSAQRYIKFASDCMAWAAQEHPELNGLAGKLEAIARDMVMQSALSFTELCREVGFLRVRPANGARDGKAGRKTPGAGQPEQLSFRFNYDVFDGTLAALGELPDNPFMRVDRAELAATKERLEKALTLVSEALSSIDVETAAQ